jgi:alkylation response protein AidB-like acyl-CoA dehydrogenase
VSEPNDDQIAAEVRAWLKANWNPELRLIEWRTKLADSGWGMPHWPKQWHGRGLPVRALPAINDEFVAIGAVGAAATGPRILASVTLLEHGSDAIKQRFLRRIITGEDGWCQLFSEPGSGSDLAGATTRADFDGKQWVVNGQKVWNTSAHHADYGLLVARTDWDAPKHQGLTYFILDMRQRGVQVLPLKQMNGHASFNQVFFTDATIPADWIVGTKNNGWAVAMTTLAHERRPAIAVSGAGFDGRRGRTYDEARAETEIANEPYKWYPQRAGRVDLVVPRAKETGAWNNPVVRQEIAKLLTLSRATNWMARRAAAAQRSGRPQGPEGSLGKLAGSNVARQASLVHTLITGAQSMLTGKDAPLDGLIAEILVSVPATSIAGGTDEIQRNIIGERVLGLPKDPRSDAGPFRDIPRNIG